MMETPEVLFILGLSFLALWRRHVMLYIGAFIGLLLYGLALADSDLTLGIPVLILGGFMLYEAILYFFGK